MNYRELLKKYIDHVGESEGTTFIYTEDDSRMHGRFTPEEHTELVTLSEELWKETP